MDGHAEEIQEEIQTEPLDDIVSGIREEFLADSSDTLRSLNLCLEEVRAGRKPGEKVLAESRRQAILFKGQAANLGLRLITTVAHRMEDYLTNHTCLDDKGRDDLQVFLDTLTDIVEGNIPSDSDAAEIVRQLPPKPSFEVEDIEVRDVEVMLVMLHGAATHFVEREMQQCGYRITNVTNPFEALPLIVQTKPDMVVISAVLPDLGGIDLAIALRAMPETRNMPVALITSYPRGHESLALLPDSVPVIRKGPSFGDDLSEALNQAFLL